MLEVFLPHELFAPDVMRYVILGVVFLSFILIFRKQLSERISGVERIVIFGNKIHLTVLRRVRSLLLRKPGSHVDHVAFDRTDEN